MFTLILYYLFRVLAQVYLYFANTAGHWKVLERSWENNNILFNRFRIKNEGHERHFVFVDADSSGIAIDEDSIDWHQVIKFSDSILACTINSAKNPIGQIDITDTIKEFSHYIYSNSFLTLKDLISLFNIETRGPYYNVMIVFSDLSEKECFVKDIDSLQTIFTLTSSNLETRSLEEVPFM